MSKKITRWSPDTCGCVLEYEWDDKVAPELRTHAFSKLINRCPVHALSPTDEGCYDTVLEENQRKNKTFGIAEAVVPGLQPENYHWVFDAGRKLEVDFVDVSLDLAQKNQIAQECDTEFGPGKVKVMTAETI